VSDVRRSGRRFVLKTVVAFVVVGMVLPAMLPVLPPDQRPPRMIRIDMSKVLFWIDTLVLPAGTSDAIRIPANLATTALWGLVVGLVLCRFRSKGNDHEEPRT